MRLVIYVKHVLPDKDQDKIYITLNKVLTFGQCFSMCCILDV